MLDAIAAAAGVPGRRRAPRRDAQRQPARGRARGAGDEGAAGLARFAIALHRPVQPMLAQPADDIAEALAQLGTAALEWKLDGAAIQVHKAGDEVRSSRAASTT